MSKDEKSKNKIERREEYHDTIVLNYSEADHVCIQNGETSEQTIREKLLALPLSLSLFFVDCGRLRSTGIKHGL